MNDLSLFAWAHAVKRIRPPEPNEVPLSIEECRLALALGEGFRPAAAVVSDAAGGRLCAVWARSLPDEEGGDARPVGASSYQFGSKP